MARRPPGQRPNPRKRSGKPSRKLSTAQKNEARKSAKKAGRRYPNLVDNMRVAARSRRRQTKR